MSASTVDLTKDTFSPTLAEHDIVLVDFWAPWCGPCRQFAPVYEQVSGEYPDVVFAKVNTEDEQELAAAGQITSIPTLMAFREGILVFEQAGALPARTLRDLVDQVSGLDMDEVRAAIEAERTGQTAAPAPAPSDPTQPPTLAPGGTGRGVPGVDYPDENGAVV